MTLGTALSPGERNTVPAFGDPLLIACGPVVTMWRPRTGEPLDGASPMLAARRFHLRPLRQSGSRGSTTGDDGDTRSECRSPSR